MKIDLYYQQQKDSFVSIYVSDVRCQIVHKFAWRMTPNPDFKGTPLFDVERFLVRQLQNVYMQRLLSATVRGVRVSNVQMSYFLASSDAGCNEKRKSWRHLLTCTGRSIITKWPASSIIRSCDRGIVWNVTETDIIVRTYLYLKMMGYIAGQLNEDTHIWPELIQPIFWINGQWFWDCVIKLWTKLARNPNNEQRSENKKLSYRQQIVHYSCAHNTSGHLYNSVTLNCLKSRLRVTQGHWKWRRSIDHIRLSIGRPLYV